MNEQAIYFKKYWKYDEKQEEEETCFIHCSKCDTNILCKFSSSNKWKDYFNHKCNNHGMLEIVTNDFKTPHFIFFTTLYYLHQVLYKRQSGYKQHKHNANIWFANKRMMNTLSFHKLSGKNTSDYDIVYQNQKLIYIYIYRNEHLNV